MRVRFRLLVPLVVALIAIGVPASYAVHQAQDRIVSADPVGWTPNVQDGAVRGIAQVGGTIVAGGDFTQVKQPGGVTLTRQNLFAFDAATGEIDADFAPAVTGGRIDAVVSAPDGRSVFIGGAFTQVNGQAARSIAKIDIETGELVAAFRPPTVAGVVKDVEVRGGQLFVGGVFSRMGGAQRTSLAALDPQSGALLDSPNLAFTGTHTGDGNTGVWKLDVTPDATKLVAVGNFTSIAGQRRDQIVMVDLTGSPASVANWYTPRFEAACNLNFDTYMRDVDFSPDGSYLVTVSTGSYRAGTLCDTAARFESAATGTGIQPTWVDYTGGDTLTAVAITGTTVYVGGHQRWMNNPFCGDRACQGAIDRPGLAALDPANGLPYSWNPGRDRGVGVWDFLATDAGLWVGHDTNRLGGEWHPRLALLPLAGGVTPPPAYTGELPADIYQAGGLSAAVPSNEAARRTFNGTTAGPLTPVDSGVNWAKARGGFMINNTLYTGWSDGGFYKRGFDGTTFGPKEPVDTADQLAPMSSWHAEVPQITGMFYDSGRLYYTLSGQTSLYYRYFQPESDIVGAQRLVASEDIVGINFDNVAGLFTVGDKMYWANARTGALRSMTFTEGRPVPDTVTLISTADWRSRALFNYAGTP